MAHQSRVLVVDDEDRNRALIQGYLHGRHTVVEAASGPEALELVAREPVDLVLLDVMMPGMSGFDVCRELKRRGEGRVLLPVILVTALGEQVDRIAGLEAGADDYLTKPVDRHELRLRVEAFLRLRHHDRLVRDQFEELQHLDALKDDLVSLIVHDLRNPLASVLALLDVVQGEVSDPQVKEDVIGAFGAASKMKDLLDDVLRIRLLEENELAPQRRVLPVADVVRDALASVEPSAAARGVRLELAPGRGVEAALDRALVRRAVENLLVNAVRYSPKGESVTVEALPVEGGVEISVSDRGPGVPEPLRGVLFEKFGSIEAARGQARRGHGLGLYLVKLVASAHGGRAVVRGREGGGSVFGLWLPPPGGPG